MKQPKLITATRGDDLGMQIYARLYAINYCEFTKDTYVHTPMKESLSNYEDFFNLASVEPKVSKKIIDIGDFAQPTTISKHHHSLPALTFGNAFRKIILQKYKLTKKAHSAKFEESQGVKIAIHVRKSSNEGKRMEIRDTPNFFIQSVINRIHSTFKRSKVSIHIYSNKKIVFNIREEVLYNKNLKIYTHYQSDIKESLHDMIHADYLFKYGISTFSGICSLYRTKPTFFEFPPGMNYLINAFKSQYNFFYNEPIKFPVLKNFGDLFPCRRFVSKDSENWIENL